ncbi:MAG: RSP_7527 family protein [Rhodocyclaceae bacterium]
MYHEYETVDVTAITREANRMRQQAVAEMFSRMGQALRQVLRAVANTGTEFGRNVIARGAQPRSH